MREGMKRVVARMVLVAFLSLSLFTCGGGGGGGGAGGGGTGAGTTVGSLTPAQKAIYDDELPAISLALQASTQFESAFAANQSDPMGALVTSLQSNPDVAQVERFDDDATIIVTMKTGIAFSLPLAEKNRVWVKQAKPSLGNPPPGSDLSVDAPAIASAIVCDPTTFPQSKKACIVPAFQNEFNQNFSSMSQSLQRVGFQVTTFSLKTAQDLTNLQNSLKDCGVLYISSHGGRGKNLEKPPKGGNNITTEIEVGLPDKDKFASSLVDMIGAFGGDMQRFLGVTAHGGKVFYTLTPEFWTTVKYPNTLVYADACSSDKDLPASMPGGSLKDAFRKNGAGAFMGWKGPIDSGISDWVANKVFDGLAPKALNITGITADAPTSVGAGVSYSVSATVQPPTAGIELRLGVKGTDGYSKEETKTTDASGKVTFSSVPGGAAGVVDTVTVSAGGADTSNTATSVVVNDPTLQNPRKVPGLPATASVSTFICDAGSNFNLACNNTNLTSTKTIVKFQ